MKRLTTPHTSSFDNWSTTQLIQEIEKVADDVELAYTSFGGSTAYGQELARFISKHSKKVSADVSGMVASMGFYILPFFENVKGAEQADLMIHSVLSNEAPTKHTAQFFYDALSKKINKNKFAEITGHKLKDVVFATGDQRVNIWITGKQAGEMGLFDETYSLLDKAADLNQFSIPSILSYDIPEVIKEKYAKTATIIIPQEKQKQEKNDMDITQLTKEDLMTGNPVLVAAIKEDERKRIGKIAKYFAVDEKKAQDIIDSGKNLTIEDVEYFMEKKAGLEKVAELEDDSSDDFVPTRTVKTAPPANKTEEQKEAEEKEASLKEVQDELGLNQFIDNLEKN
jgi:ATP-dependent protease ClpP protease subunit